ncbi:hypothetical protein FOWG_17524 [Fusarium oxysporum f. sp. lycopersici MN25]|nr:hypothetical protein FOWG_17524 [Fusarium oxysporum f. sp. lycopersici MN25]
MSSRCYPSRGRCSYIGNACSDSLEKPSLYDRDYRVIRLDNELEALLVHDPETDKASAALDVNVGNFSDESDIPGMAHAVEHLLFMGTKKFLIENEYGQYLSANSGSPNAYTGPTSTNYFFDISAKPDNDQDPSDNNLSLREALDRFAQAWWKKDDSFWVPRADVNVSLKTPLIYASPESNVKARLFSDLVRDALEEYSYEAELAGLQYNVSLDSRGLFLDVSGYNDKLPVLLEQAVTTMRDLHFKEDRYEIVRERLTRGLFQEQMLGQVLIEVYVHGNMYREDALKATVMVESILKPRVLPRAQWPILRSLILTEGSNYVFRKTIKEDRDVRTKALLLDQMLHEPAFDQLRTKEQLGYIVFSGPRAFSTTYGFRFLIQSEMTPEFLDSRIESFLMRYADTMEKMSETENLGQESTRHWSQITNEFYDFELAQRDAAQIKLLTKPEVEGFFNQRLNPASSQRARLSIHLQAQGKAEGVAKRQKRLRRRPTRSPPQERT